MGRRQQDMLLERWEKAMAFQAEDMDETSQQSSLPVTPVRTQEWPSLEPVNHAEKNLEEKPNVNQEEAHPRSNDNRKAIERGVESTCNTEKNATKCADYSNRSLFFSSSSLDIDHRQIEKSRANGVHLSPASKMTYVSVIRQGRRKACIETLKSVLKLVLKVIISLLISIALISTMMAFATEITAISQLEDSFDVEIPVQAKIMAALLHSTPSEAKDRKENYNVFFNLDRYQYLID